MTNIHLIFIPAEAKSHYSAQMLEKEDRQRLASSPNLATRADWRTARLGKYWCRLNFPHQPICLSHKQGASLLAIGWNTKPGVDLETLRQRNVHNLITLVGSSSECKAIANSASPLMDFYYLWTMKESLIKAENLDFPSDMRRVGFTWGNNGQWQLSSTKDSNYLWIQAQLGSDWLFTALWPDIASTPTTLTVHQPYGSALALHGFRTNACCLTLQQSQEPDTQC